ncbi:MAG: hypothetical protein C5B57_10890, partial [Blastocatellia bacterium]
RHRAARKLFQQLNEAEMEAASWHQLGRIYQEQRQWDEAERHYREAARINVERGHITAAAHTWGKMALLAQEAGKPRSAEDWYRKALDVYRQVGDHKQVADVLNSLAALLRNQSDRLGDALELAEEALAVAQRRDRAAPDIWKNYALLADIIDREAEITSDNDRRAKLESQARDYRELQRHAPVVLAALAQTGDSPTYAKAVILGRLARCFHMGRRPDLAVAYLRQAITTTAALGSIDEVESLRSALHLDLGDALNACGHDADARQAHEVALKTAEGLNDLRGQAAASQRLGRAFHEERQRNQVSALQVTIYDDVMTDYVFEPDLLVDGLRERRVANWTGQTDAPGDHVRPMLLPLSRSWMDPQGEVRFTLPVSEPIVERHPGCIVMRRFRRELSVSANPNIVWHLVHRLDGSNTVAEILSGLPEIDRPVATRMLAALAATGTIDTSGRPVARFIHLFTKKGVLPAGGLEGEAVLSLATDGNYREYPEATRIAVNQSIPDRLRSFHMLTRLRRSSRDYCGLALSERDFDALVHTACGVTGTMAWAGREVKLRAYPSSGALYTVEIYPIVLRVEGLEPAVYHYRPIENVLELVRPSIEPEDVVGAALPVERDMVSGAAALFCLTGCFPRHERKYGEGGYRMLVAEAGHISQNLILASTALGLSARPFGGVFDDVLNRCLGLDSTQEQFLLAVLVGHSGKTAAK